MTHSSNTKRDLYVLELRSHNFFDGGHIYNKAHIFTIVRGQCSHFFFFLSRIFYKQNYIYIYTYINFN